MIPKLFKSINRYRVPVPVFVLKCIMPCLWDLLGKELFHRVPNTFWQSCRSGFIKSRSRPDMDPDPVIWWLKTEEKKYSWKLFYLSTFSMFAGHFCPPGPGSGYGSRDPIDSGSDPDTDQGTPLTPDPIRIRIRIHNIVFRIAALLYIFCPFTCLLLCN